MSRRTDLGQGRRPLARATLQLVPRLPASLATALALLAASAAPLGARAATERIEVHLGVDAAGAPSALWLELLARRLPEERVAEGAALVRPLTREERAWEERIRERTAVWLARLPELVALFEPVAPPRAVRVVLGNRLGEDAFTHDPTTVGFDLSRLVALYGDARSEENRDRIDRLYLHEHLHLLQKAWFPEHPQPMATPFELAELEIWTEGLGNHRSMSAKWRAEGGTPSAAARAALDRLEPRYVERMTALACAPPEEARRLTADLSNGPFAEKWGALTAALWLEREASADPTALRRFVQGGAAEVRELARRNLPPALFADLERARERADACR